MRIEKNVYINLYLILIPFLSILFNGYSFGEWDQETYIPEIINGYDQSYYPHDYIFNAPVRHYSFFIPLMIRLLKICTCPLDILFFAGYMICLLIVFWAIYHLALNLFASRSAAFLSLILMFAKREVAGTQVPTLEHYFSIRTPALALALLFLLFLANNRYYLASISCGLTFLMHPIMALPLMGVHFIRLLRLGLRFDKKKALNAAAVLFAISLPLILTYFSFSETRQHISEDHLAIIQIRAGYIFLSQWVLSEFITLIAYLLLLLLVIINRRYINEKSSLLFDFLIVWGVLLVTGYIFTDIWPNHFIIQLQLYRSTLFIVFLTGLYVSPFLIKIISSRQLERRDDSTLKSRLHYWSVLLLSLTIILLHVFTESYVLIVILFAMLLIDKRRTIPNALMLLLASGLAAVFLYMINIDYFFRFLPACLTIALAFFLAYHIRSRMMTRASKSSTLLVILFCNLVIVARVLFAFQAEPHSFLFEHINLPGMTVIDPWRDVCLKCKESTEKDALVIVPLYTRYFRVLSERSHVANWKDGTYAIFSERIASEWYMRMRDLDNYHLINNARVRHLSEKYGAHYIITAKEQVLAFPVVYQNSLYTLYFIPPKQPAGGKMHLNG